MRRVGDPIEPWDSDHTALVHVLWDVKRKGLTVEKDADEIAARIMRSHWIQAVRAHAVETNQERQSEED